MEILNQTKVNEYSYNLKLSNQKIQQNTEKISSGKKINKAKDNPTDLAIAQNLYVLVKSLDKANQNIANSNSVLSVADGALSSISDNLQQIRELSISASSSLLSDSDRKIIQEEINLALESINDIANNTQFNGKNLLDGSFKNMNIANNTDGSGTEISINSVTTNALGIDGFNVTKGNIDLSAIDKALDEINSSRTEIGALSNRLDYTYNSNSNTSLNTISAKSKTEDTDMAKASIDKNINKALNQYNIFTKKNAQQMQLNMLNILF